ncbi:hypothetical protein UlMin_034096 [Ulmus minor]
MGNKRRSKVYSEPDRQNWHKIFKALTQMVKTEQTQLESFAKDRKILEDRLRMQHERWVSDVRLLKDQISLIKGDLLLKERASLFEVAELELAMGLKLTHERLEKLRLEYAEDELKDFKVLFDLFSQKCSDPKGGVGDSAKRSLRSSSEKGQSTKDPLNSLGGGGDSAKRSLRSSGGKGQSTKDPESEVSRLKQEYEKLVSERNSEVSALLAEKKFVWKQYEIMEKEYTSKLKSKGSEVEQAEEKVQKLIATVEQLESSNSEKDERIALLTSQVAKTKDDSNKLKEETLRLSEELDLMRKSINASATPVLQRCTAKGKPSSLGGKNSTSGSIQQKSESSSVQDPDSTKDTGKGGRSSKRKIDDVASSSETPKLFSSQFKVPKLKK